MPGQNVKLYRAICFNAAWENVLIPWLESTPPRFDSDPCAIIVPSMTYANFIKENCVKNKKDLFGIHIFTHTQLWNILHDAYTPSDTVADRNMLHMILSASAEQSKPGPIVSSIIKDPSVIMRAIDQLSAAGWNSDSIPQKKLSELFTLFQKNLKLAGLKTAQEIEADFLKLSQSKTRKNLFARILIIGFDNRHWPLWNLLHTAINSARSAEACLFEPRMLTTSDEAWINSWEEQFGEADILNDDPGDFSAFAESMETVKKCQLDDPPKIIIGEDILENAKAIAASVIGSLASGNDTRIGVLFPDACPLSREVSRLLSATGISHIDNLAYLSPYSANQQIWITWIDWQKRMSLDSFMQFLRLCPSAVKSIGHDIDTIERKLNHAHDLLLSHDIRVLSEYSELNIGKTLGILPQKASLHDYLKQVVEIMNHIPDMKDHDTFHVLQHTQETIDKDYSLPVSKEIFMAWLTKSTLAPDRKKNAGANHPYSRVHLLSYSKADWQSWTHLILTSLNEESWPPAYNPSPYLPQELIDSLNRKAVQTGSQGKGQTIVKSGKGLLIGTSERSTQVKHIFYNLIDTAKQMVVFCASRNREDDPTRHWPPSDFMVRANAALTGHGLTDKMISEYNAATKEQLAGIDISATASAKVSPDKTSISRMIGAYTERRDPERPFGRYEFTLAKPPSDIKPLNVTSLTDVINTPEIVWLSEFAGVEPAIRIAEKLAWNKTRGTYSHSWIRRALNEDKKLFFRLPDHKKTAAALKHAVNQSRTQCEAAYKNAGSKAPAWWHHFIRQSEYTTLMMIKDLYDIASSRWNTAASEINLPSPSSIPCGTDDILIVKGRMDLILCDDQKLPASLQKISGNCLLIDFKTGKVDPMTAREISNGKNLQILVYALSLASLGNKDTQLVIIGPENIDPSPESVSGFITDATINHALALLAKKQATGIFGMSGNPDDEYSYATYPIATLSIPPDVLAAKEGLLESLWFPKK